MSTRPSGQWIVANLAPGGRHRVFGTFRSRGRAEAYADDLQQAGEGRCNVWKVERPWPVLRQHATVTPLSDTAATVALAQDKPYDQDEETD